MVQQHNTVAAQQKLTSLNITAAEDRMRGLLIVFSTYDGDISLTNMLKPLAFALQLEMTHLAICSQRRGKNPLFTPEQPADRFLWVQGYIFGVVSAFMSALAAVYTEWVMKRNNDSLYWQNMQLYTFGVAFNAFGLVLGDLRTGESPARALSESAPLGAWLRRC